MSNAMQLKARLKEEAKKRNLAAPLLMQNFMLERVLERVSLSKYQSNFILKGGFLIAAITGLESRSTMDIDATLKGFPLNEDSVKTMFNEIFSIDPGDGIKFVLQRVEEIREQDDYQGYRLHLSGHYPPIAIPLKLDLTTGDKITPSEIKFNYRLLLEDRSISIMAYNLETVLAEKLESIIYRGDQNERPYSKTLDGISSKERLCQ